MEHNQQFNSNIKTNISLVSGIISLIIGLLPTIFIFLGMNPMSPSPILNIVFLLPLIALIGLIFGLMGLRSSKRKIAITGIVLCIIGLLSPIILIIFF